MRRPWELTIYHAPRERNTVTDQLAALGANNTLGIYVVPPDGVLNAFLNDLAYCT